jgi:methyl-accepting chemotaxis protein
MRIFPRLLILFIVIVIISSSAIAFLDYFYFQASNTHADAVKTSFAAQQIATEQQVNLQRMNALLQARFAQIFANGSPELHGDPSLAASGGLLGSDIAARESDFDQTLVTYTRDYQIMSSGNMSVVRNILLSGMTNSYLIANQKTVLEAVSSHEWNVYKSLQDQVLNALNSPNPDYVATYALLYRANETFLILQKDWNTIVDIATTVGQSVTGLSNAEMIPLQIATLVAIALTLTVILATALIVTISISRPLRQLATLTRRISNGDTSERAQTEGRDEIQMVAISMNGMLDNIVSLMHDAQLRHISLQTQIEKLVKEIQGVGEGDLRVHAEVSPDSSLKMMASSFNYVISELSTIVVKFKTLANEVERATMQAYDEMLQVVDDTDEQIQQITKATAQVLEMAKASRHVVESAQSLSLVGNETYTMTQNGRNSLAQASSGIERISTHVSSTVARVRRLEEHSQEIDTIVKIISGIANQTNRLALDTAIQAAMAGENGRGFRAVAEDIRRAAETAKAQTVMGEHIVKQVFEDVQAVARAMYETELETMSGMRFSRDAGTAFDAIVTSTEHQAQEIGIINRVARQQLESSNLVLQVMQTVSASTHQSSQNIHAEAERMEGVAQLAERLLASAEVFKLDEDQDIFAQTNTTNEGVLTPDRHTFYQNTISSPSPANRNISYTQTSPPANPLAPSLPSNGSKHDSQSQLIREWPQLPFEGENRR